MFAKLDDISVHYHVVGQGRPLVLLHGYTIDYRSMTGCMEPGLADRPGWQRIYLDLPGMGLTQAREWITSSDQMLDVVCSFIERVIPGQNFALGGYSYGGYLAQGVQQRLSDRVDGLLLLCPMVKNIGERDLPPAEVRIADTEFLARLTPEQREEFGWSAVQTERVWNRIEEAIGNSPELGDAVFLNRLQQDGYTFSFDVAGPGSQPFEKPTLIVVGRQDSAVGYKDQYAILERFPRATYAVLDRAGHELPYAQDRLFDALVIEWLDRVEEASPIN